MITKYCHSVVFNHMIEKKFSRLSQKLVCTNRQVMKIHTLNDALTFISKTIGLRDLENREKYTR